MKVWKKMAIITIIICLLWGCYRYYKADVGSGVYETFNGVREEYECGWDEEIRNVQYTTVIINNVFEENITYTYVSSCTVHKDIFVGILELMILVSAGFTVFVFALEYEPKNKSTDGTSDTSVNDEVVQ